MRAAAFESAHGKSPSSQPSSPSPIRRGGIHDTVRNAVKIALYAALVVYAVIWAVQEFASGGSLVGLLDFYDAALWIVCFSVIELNVFDFETKEEAPTFSAASS